MNNEKYIKFATDRAKRSVSIKNCTKAFFVGGLICCMGQALSDIYVRLGADEKTAATLVSVSLIFLGGLLTGIGVFDRIGKFAGAGTLVPITGFANAVASSAIENKTEGFINGVCTKMFVIAGPVIVFGTLASTVYGVIYYIAAKVF